MKRERSVDINEALESEGPLTPKEQFVLALIYLRDDWEEGIGKREYSKTDGHAGWFLTLALQFNKAEEEGILPESVKKQVSDFMEWNEKDYGKRHEYPIVDIPEEIEKTKRLIQDVLTAFKPEFHFDDLPLKDSIKERLLVAKTWFGGVPDRIVHSTDGPWKIRLGWFLGLASELSLLTSENMITGEAKESADEYLKWWKSLAERTGQIFFTKADIERGDKVIDNVVANLATEG